MSDAPPTPDAPPPTVVPAPVLPQEPFAKFEPEPGEVVATVPEHMRPPTNNSYVMVNDAGGFLITTEGEIQWIPK